MSKYVYENHEVEEGLFVTLQLIDAIDMKYSCCFPADIEKDIEKRDYQDMHRDISPLKQAEDAVLLDSSDMGIEEVIDAMIALYEKKKQ